jgi:hypothetical protein
MESLAALLPRTYHEDVLVVGSLAAACHFSTALEGRAILTKDADFVVQPAVDLRRGVELAEELRSNGWSIRNESGFPPGTEPKDPLPHVKLLAPPTGEFWVEFQGPPEKDQRIARSDLPVRFAGAWYSIPRYRFMGLATIHQQRSAAGLNYADPSMMALANLLAHPRVGTDRVTLPLTGTRGGLRSAKDLGRALAIASLTPLSEMETWPEPWLRGLKEWFPGTWYTLTPEVEKGLADLLSRPDAMSEAVRFASETGLLSGGGASVERLRAIADQLREFAIKPFMLAARG